MFVTGFHSGALHVGMEVVLALLRPLVMLLHVQILMKTLAVVRWSFVTVLALSDSVGVSGGFVPALSVGSGRSRPSGVDAGGASRGSAR